MNATNLLLTQGQGWKKKAFSVHQVDRIKFCPFIFGRPSRDEFILSKGLSRSQVLELKINISSFFFFFLVLKMTEIFTFKISYKIMRLTQNSIFINNFCRTSKSRLTPSSAGLHHNHPPTLLFYFLELSVKSSCSLTIVNG